MNAPLKQFLKEIFIKLIRNSVPIVEPVPMCARLKQFHRKIKRIQIIGYSRLLSFEVCSRDFQTILALQDLFNQITEHIEFGLPVA